ncbi:PQQ-dependent sugar dehydrogenase [Lentzea tibetensis]|uniref:PQQ-dependent sugar dehydrogenase n=1 Tax=Lentzea tibetensis TaxID=2591470 RepID=A0A563EMU8_9PSEU|nr:PQQ-dependent sugar dehydrogenase [Lentzea tibetensis]TWP48648.1 PQQ-dependent sugar dehydrogenase [Lentzea tibetensis]
MSARRIAFASVLALAVGTFVGPTAQAADDVEPMAIKQIASGLKQAWGLDFLPDGTGVFTQKDAKTVSTITKDGKVTKIADIPGVSVTKEAGLLGVAVSPDFATDKLLYIYYTTGNDNRIAKLPFGTSTPQPIVTGIPRGSQFHHGGRLEFGPDGYLYAGTGDGQNGGNAQNKNSLGGKVLRMTKDGKPAPGNPFNSLVYSYGHRNVQGLAWLGSTLYVSDIGASKVDELNKIESGKNYGWPTCEGSCNNAGFVNPVKQWPTSSATPSGLASFGGKLYMASLKGGTYKLDASGNGGKIYTNLGRTRAEEDGPDNSLWVVTPGGIYIADGN